MQVFSENNARIVMGARLHMTDTPAEATSQRDGAALSTAFQGALLDQFRAQVAGQDLWVFGYASLLWRPEF